jgi:hypothetical protein
LQILPKLITKNYESLVVVNVVVAFWWITTSALSLYISPMFICQKN